MSHEAAIIIVCAAVLSLLSFLIGYCFADGPGRYWEGRADERVRGKWRYVPVRELYNNDGPVYIIVAGKMIRGEAHIYPHRNVFEVKTPEGVEVRHRSDIFQRFESAEPDTEWGWHARMNWLHDVDQRINRNEVDIDRGDKE